MQIFELTKSFPRIEDYSLTSQVRRSSRSVAANLAEAWCKRRYQAAFIAKIVDCEAEAAETQTWLDFATTCGYLTAEQCQGLVDEYEKLIRSFKGMVSHADEWCHK
ncbi:MAG: four helix bundle protein [Fimbriimonadales bacterium]